MYQVGFDNEKYIQMQSQRILRRVNDSSNKLYLEFGGKLFDDSHASRVLPGFEPNNKIRLLKTIADELEIILVISAIDIEQTRIRDDYGISYGDYLLLLIDAIKENGLYVGSIVITHYTEQIAVQSYKKRLELLKLAVYLHYPIEDYPSNIPLILSDNGFGKNDFIQTSRDLVVITGPGSGSGKMATCLSQIYHEFKQGVKAGYAKFELFPIWNLPLNHPINLAYEAATVNIKDVNMIDPYHLEAYGVTAVNYNRDVEGFSVLNAILKEICDQSPYKSPTDMGVNMAGYCISDENVCQVASRQEIIRRYYSLLCSDRVYGGLKSDIQRLELLMYKAGTSVKERTVIYHACKKEMDTGTPSIAIELPNGQIITGKTTALLCAASAALLNALKVLAGISDNINLISPIMLEPIQKLKVDFLGNKNPRLNIDEVLIALSICSPTNSVAKLVLDQLPQLAKSEAHSTVIFSQVEIDGFRKLGINLTCEPKYECKDI